MEILKLGKSHKDVLKLRSYFGGNSTLFDKSLEDQVESYQKDHGLASDGIVGWDTWKHLLFDNKSTIDYDDLGYLLGCHPAAIKAIVKVESGGRSGFLSEGKPLILFEGHIFWGQLKKRGFYPEKLVTSKNQNILYPKWTKEHYKGKEAEYERLERALMIDRVSALSSVSVGLFQIMGFNYSLCGCSSVEEYWKGSCESELNQVLYFCEFIKGSGLLSKLRNKDWVGFAKGYNGPGYRQNKYDEKLERAYKSFL